MIHNPLHPGEIVRELCVDATGLTVTEAAHNLGIDRTTLSRLINGHATISPEMAIRLSIALNTPATMWMNLQRDYDLQKAEKLRKHLKVKKFDRKAA